MSKNYCSSHEGLVNSKIEELNHLKVAYNEIIKIDSKLDCNGIIKLCKFRSNIPEKYIRIFVENNFDYYKILEEVPTVNIIRLINNHKIIHKFKAIKDDLSLHSTDDGDKYVKLLVNITFYTRYVMPSEKENGTDNPISYKKGKIVKFVYQNDGCPLIVCQFGKYTYPLAEGEYEWVK